tara:strand:- start:508 stop:1527 length:1020 start_codon:yes stop_codon:yes gene_type:complete
MNLAFITGITGQDGSYLTEMLLEKKYKVFGIIRRSSMFNTTRIDHLLDKITLRYGDLSDAAGLSNYIHQIIRSNPGFKVFEIYNLAAQSHVKISFEIPEYTADIDGIGVMRLLEIIRTLELDVRKKVKFYQAGTSELYGKVLETPQNETTPFNPVSPYAAAKLYAYHMVKIYREGYGLFAVNGILFNHESPRRGKNFVTAKIINGVKDIINGKKDVIQLGNLDSKRDWGHAKDYVYGMWLMLQQNIPNDYVLATGKTWTIKQFIEKAFLYKSIKISWQGSGLQEKGIDEDGNVRIIVNPKYYRPCEVDLLLGDPKKAQNVLGWTRDYDLDKLIEDMFES